MTASDVGTSYCSMNEQSLSCEINSEEASYSSSKYGRSFSQSSKNMTRYEIMKQRKDAKIQKKRCKDSSEAIAHREQEAQKSIEQLVSFIEGKDAFPPYMDRSDCGDMETSQRSNSSINSSCGNKKPGLRKKKKKDRSLNSGTVSNSAASEPTPITPYECHRFSKSSSLDNEMSSSIGDSIRSGPSLRTEESELNNDDSQEAMPDNQTSVSWGDTLPPEEVVELGDSHIRLCNLCNQKPINNFNNSNAKAANEARDLLKFRLKDVASNWSEASRCDVVDGFPEILPIGKDAKPDSDILSNSNFNQCNHNDLSKTHAKPRVNCIHKLHADLSKKSTEDDDKLTEFSYSTNSSGDELSSKESELEEFVMVQKKKKVKVHERSSKPSQGKLCLERKKITNAKTDNFSKLEVVACNFEDQRLANGASCDLKTSDLPDVQSSASQFEKGMFNCPQSVAASQSVDIISHSLISSNVTSPENESLSKNELVNSFKCQLLNEEKVHTGHKYINKNISSSLEFDKHLAQQCIFDEMKSVPQSVVKGEDTVFFDTRYLNKLEKNKNVGSSDFSFIFEDHSKNNNGSPKKLSEADRFDVKYGIGSRVVGSNYFEDGNNNVDCLPVDISTSCSSEDGLNVSEKDKGSQCTSSEILNCAMQPNILMLPKQVYPCADDLMMPLPYLPFATNSPFNPYQVGFASSSECIVDQGQVMSQDSELGPSQFQLQPTLPMISPMYAPYNCYLAVIPSVSHEAPYLTNHPDIGYCELTCLANENETAPNYSGFPYHRKLDAEDVGSPMEDDEVLPLRDLSPECSSLTDDGLQANVCHFSSIHNNVYPDKFNASSFLNCKENLGQNFSPNKESKMNSESSKFKDSIKKDEHNLRVPFRISHLQNLKRGCNRNAFDSIAKKNVRQHQQQHHHSDGQEKIIGGKDQTKDFSCGNSSTTKAPTFKRFCHCNNHRSKMACSCLDKNVTVCKSSFNLESAQLYLHDC